MNFRRDPDGPAGGSIRSLMLALLVIGCQSAAPAPVPVEPRTVGREPLAKSDLARPVEPAPAPRPAAIPAAPPACSTKTAAQVTVDLKLSKATLARLFPVQSQLPWPYRAPGDQSRVPQTLEASIETFLTASLKRDGFSEIRVTPKLGAKQSRVSISASGCNLADYAVQLPRFLEAGLVALAGWDRCVKEGVCKHNQGLHPCASSNKQCAPWAFYLPLGLPLVNHWSVMLLDYPPADALCGADYLGNFSMNRWAQIYAWQGVAADSYAALVDVHPIAAAGSGESTAIQKAGSYFTEYVRAMLRVLTTPPNLAKRAPLDYSAKTLTVLASGAPAQQAWGALLGLSAGQELKAGDMGTTDRLVQGAQTAWVTSNHPVVTSSQCCAKDQKCVSETYGNSWDLVRDERLDFLVACWMRLAQTYPQDPFSKRAECEALVDSMASERCAQARLDYSFDSDGNCHCPEAAKAFCAAHQQKACPMDSEGPYQSCSEANAARGCPARQPSSWFRCQVPR